MNSSQVQSEPSDPNPNIGDEEAGNPSVLGTEETEFDSQVSEFIPYIITYWYPYPEVMWGKRVNYGCIR